MGTTFDDADGTAVLSCPGVRIDRRIVERGQSLAAAQFVADRTPLVDASAGQTHLPAGASVGRADDDVVVQMVPVQMRGDDVPVFTARDRLGQRDAHLVHPLRGHVLVRSERMLQMQRQHASLAHAVRA